ncbi:hypothetical protein [Clostridium tetanomorphum]|nr:galactose-1-phosphate uridylyltransferase [Clostridium tetanomorphum]
MGLAILPGRLKKELETIGYILQEKIVYNNVLFTNETELYKHKAWIEELINKYGVKCSKEESEKYLKYEIGNKFLQVLKDAAVFKDDENGKLAFLRFINSLGFKTAQ